MSDRDAGVRAAFVGQAQACSALGSGFTAHLCEQFAQNLTAETPIGAKCLSWAGDPATSADNVPLRLCGGLHALALTGRAPALAADYAAAQTARPSWKNLRHTLERQSDFLCDWVESPPQTNEVSRASALWPSFMAIESLTNKPLALLELGASGGLNLQADRFAFDLNGQLFGDKDSAVSLAPEWKGASPIAEPVTITSRAGCDLAPLDPTSEADALRLTAYVWPDQPARLERLRAALEIAQRYPIVVQRQDALAFLGERLKQRSEDVCTVIYSTVAWQYLPPDAQATGTALIEHHGKAAKPNSLAWLRMEADGQSPGAGIDLVLNPGRADERKIHLGRAHFHGAWVDWQGIS